MKNVKYFVVVIMLCCAAVVEAQDHEITLKLNYSVAVPTGSFKTDIINNTSYSGFGAEMMYHINSKVAVGLETAWQDFYQKYPRQLYKTADGSDISTVLTNSIQTVPIMLKGQYRILPYSAVQPYVALAAGMNLISYIQYAGEFSTDGKNKLAFAARPEAGIYVLFGVASSAGFSLGAGYNYMPFNYNDISNFNNLTFRAGISFPLH